MIQTKVLRVQQVIITAEEVNFSPTYVMYLIQKIECVLISSIKCSEGKTKDKGNTAVCQWYAHARICSIQQIDSSTPPIIEHLIKLGR